jgi:6,7-dimethyl-8-ribityllumazine synthase
MSKYIQTPIKSLDNLPQTLKIAFVVAERNKDYTQSLADINAQVFLDHGYTQPDIFWVPGSLELPGFANNLLSRGYDIVILFGVIIKGKTMHYEFISQAIFQGLVQLSITYPQHVLIS